MNASQGHDLMQVCLRGHVITDMFVSQPEQSAGHCDRCGAPTISCCPTCGTGIPGASVSPGLSTMGRRAPPDHCPTCGAAFPWAEETTAPAAPDLYAMLETLLRRLPCAIRQLRDRRDSGPTLKVEDVFDLEDLLRVVLHLCFDDVRRETRTPSYSALTRTDFLVGPNRVAVTAKFVTARGGEPQLTKEAAEDSQYYDRKPGCGGLIVLVYDPQQLLVNPDRFEASLRADDGSDVRCVVAIPSSSRA